MTELEATPAGSPREWRPIPIRVWVAIGAGLTFALFVAVGLSTTVTVPNFFSGMMNRSQDQARADLRAISAALATFAERNGGTCPATLDLLVTPDEHGRTYLGATTLPKDPWGTG